MYDDILVPTDGSERAQKAAEHAVEVAEDHGATVHAVNVIDTRMFIGDFNWSPIRDELMRKAEDATQKVADLVRDEDDRSRKKNIVVLEDIRQGTPSEEILDYSRENDIDLIVMGRRGQTGGDILIGGVSTKVLEKSDTPVLEVPF